MERQMKGLLAIAIVVMLVVSSICTVFAAPMGFEGRGEPGAQHVTNYSSVCFNAYKSVEFKGKR